MILDVQQGLAADGFHVSLVKLCLWFDLPRRTLYYRSVKSAPKVQEHLVAPIKALIEEHPSFGYRTVAHLLGMNKNTVQRIFQIKGWQVRKRPIGMRPRIEAIPSVATAPNERWSTDLCRVWAGRDGWTTLALVIDCHTRELLGWHLSRSGKATTAASALEHALMRNARKLVMPGGAAYHGGVQTPSILSGERDMPHARRYHHPTARSIGFRGRRADRSDQGWRAQTH